MSGLRSKVHSWQTTSTFSFQAKWISFGLQPCPSIESNALTRAYKSGKPELVCCIKKQRRGSQNNSAAHLCEWAQKWSTLTGVNGLKSKVHSRQPTSICNFQAKWISLRLQAYSSIQTNALTRAYEGSNLLLVCCIKKKRQRSQDY
jgi:hypothetical protein